MARSVLSPAFVDLPIAELTAARLDGELYAIGDAYCSIAEVEGPALRAAAVRGTRSPRLIAELGTAAWVWGVTPVPPSQPEFCVAADARIKATSRGLDRVREVILHPDDVVRFRAADGGGAVTSPLRTAVDLARIRPRFGEHEAGLVGGLAQIGDFGSADCRAMLERGRNLPGKLAALERLERVLGHAEQRRAG